MKSKYFLLPLFLLLAGFLSGCSGQALPSSWPGVSAGESRAYLANNQYVYAIDLDRGNEVWRWPEKGNNSVMYFAAPVETDDGQLLVAGFNNSDVKLSTLHSLNPAQLVTVNGGRSIPTENWKFEGATDRYIAAPLVVNDTIYAPNADGNLYALDMNGRLMWTFSPGGRALWASPVYSEACDCLYLASIDHNLYAIDASTGRQNWVHDMGAATVSTPGVGEDGRVVYIGTFGNKMFALDARNGQPLWEFDTVDWVWSGPLVLEDHLYFGDLGGNIYALNRQDGSLTWQVTAEGAIANAPLVVEDILFFTSEGLDNGGMVYAFRLDGSMDWSQSLGEKTILHAPVVMAGDGLLLIAPSGSKTLLATMKTTGSPGWTFQPEN